MNRAPDNFLKLNLDGATTVANRLERKGASKSDKREYAEFQAQMATRKDLGKAATQPSLHFGMSQAPLMYSEGPLHNSQKTERNCSVFLALS